ncbi:hypothetical protein PHMEG_000928 [Phytophthora megakarya]|uniref:CST complex subunit CTC1 n=1 Tax=Phytophthora megakarya TaxID=4795 RepID=A0A225X2G0_9STRA|nr:hypothetical protein PHMEG_000928 [Phytophthora megakarya]
MFLEVHDEKPVMLLPVDDFYVIGTQAFVREVLETNYQTQDPPIKRKKQRRVHVVFGRVTSVSPISRQKDLANSHFFVEIECHTKSEASTTQSIANVMFTGVHSMRWHLFLHPGKIVLLTDLVKVFSRECEMFLLQATQGHQQSQHIRSETRTLETMVQVWDDLVSRQTNSVRWIHDSMDTYSKNFVSRYTGKLLDYEGQVCRLLYDECIELQDPDGTQVIVCLFHFPYAHELVRLRKGAIMRICGAHVLRWPTPVGGKLVIGLCPRSYFEITSFGDPSGVCVTMGIRSLRGRAHKKWSSLGDFHRQSMLLSMWLLEVLELLDLKFVFGEDDEMQLKLSELSFPRTRRRKAVSLVAKKLALSLDKGRDQVMTLGATFLKCHSGGAVNCISVELPPFDNIMACNRVLTIRELQKLGENKLNQMNEARCHEFRSTDDMITVHIPAVALDWCFVLGCIRGNIDSGNLEVFDRTGSVSVCLNGTEMAMDTTNERGVYLFRNFDFVIEDYNRNPEYQQEEKLPLVYCIRCSTDNVDFITFSADEPFSGSPEENIVADGHGVDSGEINQVCGLLRHPLTDKHRLVDGLTNEEQLVMKIVDPDLHKPHLVSVVGIITKKKLYWKTNSQKQASSRRLAYIFHIRDLHTLDTVEIRVDVSRFGLLGSLQLNRVVEFSKLQGFIARSSYKVFLNWCHVTAARSLNEKDSSSLPREAVLYGAMPTTLLNDLYHASHIDRTLHRYVVGIVHISYVVLKRKCRLCHQALQLNKRRGCWKHPDLQTKSKYSRDCAWSWQQLPPSDPTFTSRTYMGATVRCIIDDGSGQAELFLENDVTWELLTCTVGQRRRFEDILSNYVEELRYFSGRTGHGSFATSKAEREQEYYQNELRAFVLDAIPSLRSVVVFAHRFYKAKEKEGTSVLTFGKDIHIRTKTLPQPKLEAKRVDQLHVRNELQRRLSQLRRRQP